MVRTCAGHCKQSEPLANEPLQGFATRNAQTRRRMLDENMSEPHADLRQLTPYGARYFSRDKVAPTRSLAKSNIFLQPNRRRRCSRHDEQNGNAATPQRNSDEAKSSSDGHTTMPHKLFERASNQESEKRTSFGFWKRKLRRSK